MDVDARAMSSVEMFVAMSFLGEPPWGDTR